MTLPNFLIIGAAKAGTTLLYEQLALHPDVFMPEIKEPRFFSYRGRGDDFRYPAKTLAAYEALFAGVTTETAVGEASPEYLFSPVAPRRILETLPGVRLIASLRHPADRSFSVYQHNIRENGHNRGVPFAQAFQQDHVLRRGYHEALATYLELFGRERVRVVLFDDLVRRGPATLREILDYLELPPSPVDGLPAVANPGGLPRNQMLHAVLQNQKLRLLSRRFAPRPLVAVARRIRSRNLVKQAMAPEDRAAATAFFREDILRTGDLIGRDLSAWLG